MSSQLHLEAFVPEHSRVWTLSPTFRAERSDTPRHVSEFWMLEAEVRTESLHDVMDLVEDLIRSITIELSKLKLHEELISVKRTTESEVAGSPTAVSKFLHRRWDGLIRKPWPRITYSEAIECLHNAAESERVSFQHEPSWNDGLQLEHERFIVAELGQGSPIFVTDYPENIKPFYMLPNSQEDADAVNRQETVACFDLLLPEVCEIVGGSLREHRLQHLIRSLRKHGLSTSITTRTPDKGEHLDPSPSTNSGHLDWYVDLRRYGSVPHGGFGLGFDRFLGYLAGIPNIKDVVPWPRYYGRCDS